MAVAMVQGNETETEFEPVYHHYTPHRAGLPPLVPYARELWHRKPFATELSRATMRGANTSTFFGQAWLVINPLLLAGVYYLLVTILRGQHDPTLFLHLTATLFVFGIIQSSINQGSTSVTGSGKLLINTAFPRLLIPLSAVRTSFFRFLPTIPVYMVLHLALAKLTSWHPMMLGALYFLLMMVLFSMGLAAFFAALTVYFRDTSQFLPYFVRLWMYLAPVLWLPEHAGPLQPDPAAGHHGESVVLVPGRLRDAAAGAQGPADLDVGGLGGLGVRRRDRRLLVLRLEGA